MSVSSILTSLEAQVATVLGADWSELDYSYNLEANSNKSLEKKYGVGASSGSSVDGTTKALTVDFGFFIVLTRCFVNRSDDANERAMLSDMYDQFDNINETIFQKKLNNANILVVSSLDYEEPTTVGDQGLSLKVNVTIKYRNPTT